ncbi:hypothetical protein CCR75_003066 [Bremia lactucae]|uniref:Uncharacterized protein n=1 Tax=Bremia lactucae TaxID=4779 RepID=A0A976IM18_BRELC|nr:hypothetical protein CCR75_003066 [Bremia lactucae]
MLLISAAVQLAYDNVGVGVCIDGDSGEEVSVCLDEGPDEGIGAVLKSESGGFDKLAPLIG